MTDTWEFTSSVLQERASHLDAATDFAAIVSHIASTMEVLCCHYDRCRERTEFGRVIYCVRIDRPLFHLFFNSRHGYRAAYFQSPHEGLAANAHALRTLAPALLASPATTGCDKDSDFVGDSLARESAKLWLAEAGNEVRGCKACKSEWKHPTDDPVHIRNGRWDLDPDIHARWGRTAPFLTKLKIMGAFLNHAHVEFVPAVKRRRAWDIHERGSS